MKTTKKYIIGVSENGNCGFVRKMNSEYFQEFESYKQAEEEIKNNIW